MIESQIDIPNYNQDKIKLTDEEKNKTNKIVDKIITAREDDILNIKEIQIRKTLYFRIYISGTIDYGDVYKLIYINI